MRIFIILVLSSIAVAQTAAVPSSSITVPAQKTHDTTITIATPKNGGKVTFTVPGQTIPAQTANIPAVTAPVSIGTITLNFTCTGPDLQHLSCTAVQQ